MSTTAAILATVADKAVDLGGDFLLQKDSQHWQRTNAKNQYQWAVRDMKKAGLNPILAATGMKPATTGSASGSSSGKSDIAGAYSKLQAAALAKSQIELAEATSAKNLAEADRAKQETANLGQVGERLGWEAEKANVKTGLWDWIKEKFSNSAKAVNAWQSQFDQGQEEMERHNRARQRHTDEAGKWNIRTPDGKFYFKKGH